MSHDEKSGKPRDDSMRAGPIDAEDPIGEITLLADDDDSDDGEILRKLEALGAKLSLDEIFTVLARYDTPDVLG
jgi:hypothetical protein